MSDESKKFVVLFVCSGNSCRSPMAEGVLRQKLPEEISDRVIVQSAGTLGISGQPASENAIAVAREYGADISGHRSRGVTPEIISDADIIFTMARHHRDHIAARYPAWRDNVYVLRDFARKHKLADPDIFDPIGSDIRRYRQCCAIIAEELDRIMPWLVHLIERKSSDF